jgi:hypothetical protein
MTEAKRGNFSKEYVCQADISSRLTEHPDIAVASLDCRGSFCEDMIRGTAYAVGENSNEAELNSESSLRNVVKKACPQWKVVRDAGLAPGEGDDLPDQYMPPFR